MSDLDPTEFIAHISSQRSTSYVYMRRMVSAVYFSLFNLWAYKMFYTHGSRGGGPNGDGFTHAMFNRTLIKNNLGPQISYIYEYRVLVDHYLLNPNRIKMQDKEVQRIVEVEAVVTLDEDVMEKIVESAMRILEWLKDKY